MGFYHWLTLLQNPQKLRPVRHTFSLNMLLKNAIKKGVDLHDMFCIRNNKKKKKATSNHLYRSYQILKPDLWNLPFSSVFYSKCRGVESLTQMLYLKMLFECYTMKA